MNLVHLWRSSIAKATVLLLLGSMAAWGQSVSGTISGTVTDPSGAVVPNAQVAATETATGVSQTVQSNTDGTYAFLSLPVGRYQLSVTARGFEAYLRKDITLNTNDKLRFDIVLQVGQVTQQVEVTTSSVHVETDNTQLGDVIKSNAVEALPLNGRSFTNLLGLQPGVEPVSSGSYSNTFGSTEQGNVSITGQREDANGFLINGGYANNTLNSGATIIPNIDSIDEFRVLTANFDAEYGNYSGGVVTLVTKSGTNQLHGDVFEFVRNDVFDSRNFYEYNSLNPLTGAELPGTARGAFKRNQFGGTVGGPIKRDKVFFFADYQGTRQREVAATGIVDVPSAAERTGDFSGAASALTGTVNGPYFASLLSSELGYPVTSGEAYYVPGCTTGSQCVFPNAIIPQSAFSAPAKGLMKYIPLPNVGPYYTSSANNAATTDDLGSARIDLSSQRWGTISGYYFFDQSSSFTPFGGNNVPGFPDENQGRSELWNLSDVKTFGGNAVNELHLSWNRLVAHTGQPVGNYPVPLSSFGFAENQPGGMVAASPSVEGVPSIGFNNFGIGLNGVAYNRYEDSPSIIDNFSKVKGKHTLKFGGQFIFNDFYQPMPLVGANGFLSFNGAETGIDFADYLIGALDGFSQEGGFWIDNRRKYEGDYAQDSWRVRPNFTLNYGIRWDYVQPWYEKHLQSSTFVYGVQSTVYPNAPVGYVFPGDTVPGYGKIPSTISKTPLDNFSPRLGFAYSPSSGGGPLHWLTGEPGQFSIRGGFGMFYTGVTGAEMLDESGLAPYDVYYGAPAPDLFASPYTDRTTGNQRPFPFPFTPAPRGSTSFNWGPNLPFGGYPVPQIGGTTPYSENYNFTLQRQFGTKTLLSIGYVGAVGHHLVSMIPPNPGNPQLCLSLSQPNEVAPGSLTCGPYGENQAYTRADGTVFNGTRQPFPVSIVGDNAWLTTGANSTYNALQASVRYNSGPLSFFASYTYSKSLDDTSALGDKTMDPYNPNIDRGLSAFDMTHNFVASYQYTLPFNRLAGGRHPRLTDGWVFIGITRFTTGFPISLTESDDHSLLGTGGTNASTVDTPNFLGGNLNFTNPRSGLPYFNTTLFTRETIGYLGDANRAFFHGPGINNWDLSLHKDLRLTESKSLEFRAEFFNTFNHAQFQNPSGNILSGTFGVVTSAADPRIGQLALKFLF
jgi:hypothetical protein